jgi:hypothetical protein
MKLVSFFCSPRTMTKQYCPTRAASAFVFATKHSPRSLAISVTRSFGVREGDMGDPTPSAEHAAEGDCGSSCCLESGDVGRGWAAANSSTA